MVKITTNIKDLFEIKRAEAVFIKFGLNNLNDVKNIEKDIQKEIDKGN